MTSLVVAIFMTIGAAAWIFNKVMERTGGNTRNSLAVTVISSIFIFVLTLTTLALIGNAIE